MQALQILVGIAEGEESPLRITWFSHQSHIYSIKQLMSNSRLNIINSSSCLQLVAIQSGSFFKFFRTFQNCFQFTADQVSVFFDLSYLLLLP